MLAHYRVITGALMVLTLVSTVAMVEPATPAEATRVIRQEHTEVRITIVYDNYAYDPRLGTNWGFAALVEYGNQIVLFDTGGDAPTLLRNMEVLDINPLTIETVVLSHEHGDHVGGLAGLLETGVRPTVYVPPSFPGNIKQRIEAVTDLVEVTPGLAVAEGVFTTGELQTGPVPEQALVITTSAGLVVVTGCAHPGIVSIVTRAEELFPDHPVQLVVGGFHLGGASETQIRTIIEDLRELGVERVSPTHCTGDRAIAMFAEEYGDDYIRGGVGQVFVVGTSVTTAAPEPPSSSSADGHIAYYSERDGNADIFVINSDGSNRQQVTDNTADDLCPAWSPDGTRIAFVSDRHDPNPVNCFPDCNYDIYVMNADGGDQRRLTDTPDQEHHPAWSPDGTQIAFMSARDGNQDIYVMNADGSDPRRLTDNSADDMRPDWSPDGTRLLFNSMRDGNWEIYMMEADGSHQQRLTDSPAWELFPRWSPDGTQIVYCSMVVNERSPDIYVMNADGTGVRQLTDRPQTVDEDPVWSPDGTQIAFQSTRDGNFEIYVMEADGSHQRRLTNSRVDDYWPAWRPEPATPTGEPIPAPGERGDGVVLGWAVLAEKDDYNDVNMTNLPVDYISMTQMRQALVDSGWEADHIRELREFDRAALRDGLDWLVQHADQDDIVFVYVAAHGRYLSNVLDWGGFFATDWAQIPSQRRVLVVDACQAANFTGVVGNDPAPFLSVAAVAGDEYGWCGLEEEGLPIIGDVFTYYFTAALSDSAADADGDGRVSVQEAAQVAEGQQRAYMHEVVFVVPEFAAMYAEIGVFPDKDPDYPHVVVVDTIGEPLYLALDAYPAPGGN